MITLGNTTTTCGDKFTEMKIGGRVVAYLQKPNRAWGGWYVSSRDQRDIREHFSNKDAALAFAATL